jgi:hypothetical protein
MEFGLEFRREELPVQVADRLVVFCFRLRREEFITQVTGRFGRCIVELRRTELTLQISQCLPILGFKPCSEELILQILDWISESCRLDAQRSHLVLERVDGFSLRAHGEEYALQVSVRFSGFRGL